jgi:hypothetical protein
VSGDKTAGGWTPWPVHPEQLELPLRDEADRPLPVEIILPEGWTLGPPMED